MLVETWDRTPPGEQEDLMGRTPATTAALARDDGSDQYLRHTGSEVWAVPPGVVQGGRWGQQLFEA